MLTVEENGRTGERLMEKNLSELIVSATAMLLDRAPVERDLIYILAKLDDEERAAIIFAYENLKEE